MAGNGASSSTELCFIVSFIPRRAIERHSKVRNALGRDRAPVSDPTRFKRVRHAQWETFAPVTHDMFPACQNSSTPRHISVFLPRECRRYMVT